MKPFVGRILASTVICVAPLSIILLHDENITYYSSTCPLLMGKINPTPKKKTYEKEMKNVVFLVWHQKTTLDSGGPMDRESESRSWPSDVFQ